MQTSVKRRDVEQAKGVDRLGPNGHGAGTGGASSPVVNIKAPGGKGGPIPLRHWGGTW